MPSCLTMSGRFLSSKVRHRSRPVRQFVAVEQSKLQETTRLSTCRAWNKACIAWTDRAAEGTSSTLRAISLRRSCSGASAVVSTVHPTSVTGRFAGLAQDPRRRRRYRCVGHRLELAICTCAVCPALSAARAIGHNRIQWRSATMCRGGATKTPGTELALTGDGDSDVFACKTGCRCLQNKWKGSFRDERP